MKSARLLIPVLFSVLFSLPFFAQHATVRGFVYFKESGEPAPFIPVFLKGTQHAVSTDVNGYFSLSKVPAGNYTLMIKYMGYDTLRDALSLKAGDLLTKKYNLIKATIKLTETVVTAEQQEKISEVKISVNTVTPKDIKQIPSVGGEPDLAQYLQILPGVIFTGDQGGQLYIRGGSPIQNKVLLDGMIVYNPFHSIGLFSVFDTDIIRNADVYTGGFNATYGGRISSVMDITTRDGNKKRFSGKVAASPFGAKTLLEGPIVAQKDNKPKEETERLKGEVDKTVQEIDGLKKSNIRLDSLRKKMLAEKQKNDINLKQLSNDTAGVVISIRLQAETAAISNTIDSADIAMKKNTILVYKLSDKLMELRRDHEKSLPSDGSSSFILSAKTSYLPTTSKVLYSYVDSSGLPFSFNDFYGKTSINSSNGSKINFFGFHFNDKVSYQALSNLEWKSFGGGSSFIAIPQNSAILISGNFAYSSYKIGIQEEIDKPRSSEINGFNLGLDFTYFIGKNDLKYGVEVLGFKTDFIFYNYVNRKIAQTQYTTEMSGFVKYRHFTKNEKLVIEPSMRMHYYASLRNVSPEPRFGMKYNITSRIRLKAAGGLYSQNLISATSERDVVNLFYGFLSGPDNLPVSFTQQDGSLKDINHKLQKANHIIAGIEMDVIKNIDVNIEVYRKNFTQLTNINRNKLYDDDPDNSDKPDYIKKDFIIETGRAQGIDFLVKYDHKHLYVWAVYSLGFVTRWDGIEEYRPHFDRRHNVNLVASYVFGKNLDWEVDARWNMGSGFPFTPTQGFYENLDFAGGINTNYTEVNGYLGVLYGQHNSKELPYYHRMDVTVKKTVEISSNSTLELSAGASNVYNRANIFYFDRIQYKRVNQLPILPSVSASLTF